MSQKKLRKYSPQQVRIPSSYWSLRLLKYEKEKILNSIESDFKLMADQIHDFRIDDDEDEIKYLLNADVVKRRHRSGNLPPALFMGWEYKEKIREDISQRYHRRKVFSDTAFLNRWFYYLYFKLDGNKIRDTLSADGGSVLVLEKQRAGRTWKDARISNHAGAWITEKLCEKHFPEFELTEDALLKRIQTWKKALSK